MTGVRLVEPVDDGVTFPALQQPVVHRHRRDERHGE
jgi:hypothetical protein